MKFKSSYKNEKDFQSDYIKSLKEDWMWLYKLPDTSFTLKPCDIIWCKDWKFIAIELKYGRLNTYDRIYKMLRPNQVWWLLHIQEHWGVSKIIWRDNKDNKIYEYDFKYQDYDGEL